MNSGVRSSWLLMLFVGFSRRPVDKIASILIRLVVGKADSAIKPKWPRYVPPEPLPPISDGSSIRKGYIWAKKWKEPLTPEQEIHVTKMVKIKS